jgi:hypothetical protein
MRPAGALLDFAASSGLPVLPAVEDDEGVGLMILYVLLLLSMFVWYDVDGSS